MKRTWFAWLMLAIFLFAFAISTEIAAGGALPAALFFLASILALVAFISWRTSKAPLSNR